MANIRSQIKRNRRNEVQRQRNVAVRSRVRTFTRRFREALASGDRAQAEAAYREASSELDKAASKGVLHRNTAANRKSGMAKALRGI